MRKPGTDQVQNADQAPSDPPIYRLRLYISGAMFRSSQAIANIRAIGDKRLGGRYELVVIDAYQQADLAHNEQITVLPTLIKSSPFPPRRIVGDLSDETQVMIGLGLGPEQVEFE